MLKAIHIHSDIKFVSTTKCFDGELFENSVVIIGFDKKEYEGEYSLNAFYFGRKKKDLDKIVILCQKYDIVILYGLDNMKSYIANRIYGKVKIAWRFFGFELYNRMKKDIISDLSNLYSNKFNIGYVLLQIKSPIITIKKALIHLRMKCDNKKEFNNAIIKINFFLGLFEEEYYVLKRKYANLPPFVCLPYGFIQSDKFKFDNKGNKRDMILIGNSRSMANNHFDILEIIQNAKIKKDIRFLIPFNYVSHSYYSLNLKKELKKFDNIALIEDFMPLKEYKAIISNSKAAVYNTYRQMAMGNIWLSICFGLKVYLNTNNPVYNWFVKTGFKIFNISDFKSDLESGKIELDADEFKHNVNISHQLSTLRSDKHFQNELIELINRK